MAVLHVLIWCVLVIFAFTTAQNPICPPTEALSPCRCAEATKSISCANIQGRFDLKAVFDNVSPLVDPSTVFNELSIRDISSMLEILPDSITTLKFLAIDISSNHNLDHISPNAFNATYKVTKKLDMWNNYLSNAAPYETDIFQFINNFEVLESVWMPGNRIRSLPANAFNSGNTHLDTIYLGSNSIQNIGAGAFSGIANLRKVHLQNNMLPPTGISSSAFEGISSKVDVDFSYNNMNYVPQDWFKPLLDLATHVTVGGRSCSSNGCNYKRLTCDQEADWICPRMSEYEGKLSGFLCTGGIYDDVWEYCNATINNHV